MTKAKTTKKTSAAKTAATKRPTGGAQGAALQIIEDDEAAQRVAELATQLLEGAPTTATQAARVLDEIGKQKIELIIPIVTELTQAIFSKNKRVRQMAAD